MSEAQELRRLGPPLVRTAWLFQAIIAGPTFVYLGLDSLWMIYNNYYYYSHIYPPLKELSLALIAAIIVYIVIVQRNYPEPHARMTARFELTKGLLATVAWVWMLLDAIFYEPEWYSHSDPQLDGRRRRARIVLNTASVVILLIFFYPTMFWSARLAREAEQKADQAVGQDTNQDRDATEEQPLLQV